MGLPLTPLFFCCFFSHNIVSNHAVRRRRSLSEGTVFHLLLPRLENVVKSYSDEHLLCVLLNVNE